LKPEFIVGIYDSKTKSFIENDKYYEKLNISEQTKLFDEIKSNYIQEIKTTGMTVEKYSELIEEMGWENPLTAEEIVEADNLARVETVREKAMRIDDEISKMAHEKTNDKSIEENLKLSNEFLNSLNQTLLNQKVVLPNGNTIPASHYIEEIVKPRIPESGTFKLKNGIEISARQFIEEYVMFEGQTKYKGDIDALLNDTVDSGDAPPTTDGKGVGMKQEHGYGIQKEEIQTDENTAKKETITGEELKGTLKKSLVTAKEVKEQQTQIKDDKAIKEYKTLRFKKTLGSITPEEQAKMNELLNIQAVQLYDAEVNQRKQTIKKSEQNSKGMGR